MPTSSTTEPDQRVGHFLFAAFCLVAAAVSAAGGEVNYPVIQAAGVLGYPVAAGLAAAAALALAQPAGRARARRFLVYFHLGFIPVQFVLGFTGNALTLVGMVASTALVARMRPTFGKLRPRARKLWLTVHVGISVGWLGLAAAMTVLATAAVVADSHPVRHGAYELMHLFDLTVVIPSMMLALVSGIVLSLGTPWGLVRHRWVLAKLVIALVIPVIATVQSGWIDELRVRTATPAGVPGTLGVTLAACMAVYGTLLWAAVVLSIFKPGGKTRWAPPSRSGRRAFADR